VRVRPETVRKRGVRPVTSLWVILWVRVRLGTVHKGGVRPSMVCKTVLQVLRVLRVYKGAL
jgi:hypothetical protein